jgi:cytochrome P450
MSNASEGGGQAAAPLMFNPFDPAYRADPYPVFRRLREEQPVHKTLLGPIALSRYADCARMLRHPSAGSDFRKSKNFREMTALQGLDPDSEMMNRRRSFLFMDPPDHTRLRGLVNKAFTPRVVEELRPRIEALVREQLDAVAARGDGEMEVIGDLAYPLPVAIISEMLGVPSEDHERFKAWSRELARSLDPVPIESKEEMQRREQVAMEFREYFKELIAERRAAPRDDLLSGLIAAEEQGVTLSEDELLSTCILLLVAGHETTVNLIGNGMLALLRHPDQMQLLRDDPSLIRTAVEELLRFDPPVQLTGRVALADIEFGDVKLAEGETAVLLLAAANRDPEQFPDPDRLDLRREDNRHLSFGMGIHFCLGAPLARVEGQVAISEMVRRLKAPRLATEQPDYKENITLRGLASLRVAHDGAVM